MDERFVDLRFQLYYPGVTPRPAMLVSCRHIPAVTRPALTSAGEVVAEIRPQLRNTTTRPGCILY